MNQWKDLVGVRKPNDDVTLMEEYCGDKNETWGVVSHIRPGSPSSRGGSGRTVEAALVFSNTDGFTVTLFGTAERLRHAMQVLVANELVEPKAMKFRRETVQ